MSEQEERSVFGRHPVMSALKSDVPIDRIFLKQGIQKDFQWKISQLARERQIPITMVDEQTLNRRSGGGNHQGVLALLSGRNYDELEDILETARVRGEPLFILVLNEVQDSGNLGSLLRSAEGAGVHGVIIGKRRCACLSPAVSRVANGADMRLKITRVTNISDTLNRLKDMGTIVIGTDSGGTVDYYASDMTSSLALVLGGEDKGLGTRVRDTCDSVIRIPLSGEMPSLNVGVAGGIAMFEVRRQRILKYHKDMLTNL